VSVVAEGEPAPDFELKTDSGETVKLSDLRGKPVVLYFYPRDDTPGCTTQACGIRDAYQEFRDRGAVVFGISADDEASHARFKEKFELPFTLLADPERTAIVAYDVWKERKNYGKTYMGIERSTFVVDRDGNLAKELRKVKPAEHAQKVLDVLDSL
jgi:peroxiredoxin Q/BCP